MKIYLKQNFIYILSLTVLLSYVLIASYNNTKSINSFREWRIEQSGDKYHSCKNDKNYYIENKIYCNDLIIDVEKKETSITLFYELVHNLNFYYPFFIGIFAAAPAIYLFHQKMKTGFFKNVLVRQNYNRFLMKEYISSLKASFIIPIAIMFIFIFAGVFYNWNYDVKSLCEINNAACNGLIYRDPVGNNITNIFPFTFVFFFNVWLHSIFCINLAYIIDKKSNNFLITCIGYFLLFIGFELVMELFGGFVIYNFSAELYESMLVGNIWAYDGIYNVVTFILVNILFVLCSLLIVYKMYKNKEEVVIANE